MHSVERGSLGHHLATLASAFACALVTSAVASQLAAQESSAQSREPVIAHCRAGNCPRWATTADANETVVVHQLFASQIDSASSVQLPRWVAYRLVAPAIGVASLLPREWHVDELVSEDLTLRMAENAQARVLQPDLSNSQDRDYRLTEVTLLAAEQGRLTPMTSFSGTPFWDELNLLSNRAQLPSALRLGAWSRLDQALNELAAKQQTPTEAEAATIYVVSGPASAVSESGAGFFKAVALGDQKAAFFFPADTQSHRGYCEAEIALERVEFTTGLTLFPAASASQAGSLSAKLGCSPAPHNLTETRNDRN